MNSKGNDLEWKNFIESDFNFILIKPAYIKHLISYQQM